MADKSMSKHLGVVLGCTLVVSCVASTNQNTTVENAVHGPRIVFDRTVYDLGTISNNVAVIKADFPFKNTGDRDLHMKVLSMSGSYSVTSWTVPPGQTGNSPFALQFQNAYLGTNSQIIKHAKFGTDDPMNPVILLTYIINIHRPDKK
jgi:hypothetical protein